MIMHADDMKDIGVPNGSTVRVRSLWGEETFKCVEGKTPTGIIFIPYGPPTCAGCACSSSAALVG